ncbi:hypothetical protein [Changchengzhania lutea]|uniref:hypothetical protein n=1 Tax=Changchengzhania lutea TaxID=2049305 RepID=UPI00115CBDC9|nr:hypothetical protein [Changchengzhania lutea]
METKFNIFFERLKEANFSENTLCKGFWLKLKKLHLNFNESDCWELLIDNIEWTINTGSITTDELIEWFSEEKLSENNIFYKGSVNINNGFAIGLKDVEIEAVGHSRIILFDNAKCKAFDSSFVTGFNDTEIELKNCAADVFHNCRVTAKDFSKVEAWDNSNVKAETYSCVMAHDKVQVENSQNSHTIII